MAVKFSNNAVSTLTGNISAGATSFTVNDASSFPTLGTGDWTYVTIGTEVIKITAISGNTFTCVATSNPHSTSDRVELRVTSELFNDVAADTTNVAAAGALMTTGGTMTGNVSFGDNDKAIFGAGSDLEIWHTGTDTYIRNNTGHLILRNLADDKIISLQTDDGSGGYVDYVQCDGNTGATNLYYDGVKRLATTNTGIDVTGTVTADGLTVDGLTVDGTSVEVASINSTQNGAQIKFDSASTPSDWSIGVSNDAGGDFLIYQNSTGAGDINLYTDGKKRQEINNNGDISFYEDTGNTPKLVWKAGDERLGIGTSSPFAPLQITHTNGRIGFNAGNTSGGTKIQSFATTNANGYLAFEGYDKEYMRITSAGNVGIGTSSPGSLLSVALSGSTGTYFEGGGTGSSSEARRLLISASTTTNVGDTHTFNAESTSGNLAFATSNTVRMRIDSSGNLLVGKTSSSESSVGVELRPYQAIITRNNAAPLKLRRNSIDGDIVEFAKDGATVGAIGTNTSSVFQISGTATGFYFGSNNIYPSDGSGEASDATKTLGSSSVRFKDAYLSGGVYLGGTGAANKLDDYETGTWTATMSSGSVTADRTTYTKVGRLVTVQARLQDITDYTTNANVYVQGLPFAVSSSGGSHMGAVMYRYINIGRSTIVAQTATSSTTFAFVGVSADTSVGWTTLKYSHATALWDIFVSLTYETDD